LREDAEGADGLLEHAGQGDELAEGQLSRGAGSAAGGGGGRVP
jgi:hypothetical protein